MTRRHYVNNAPQRTLASSITSGATSCTVSGTFSGWPVQFPFFATLDIGQLSEEIILVTNIVGSVATITRGQDGTASVSHTAGATLDFTVGATDFDEANAHVNANTGVHGVSGSVVGTSDVQTLTNKTLTSPALANPSLTGTLTGAGAVSTSGAIGTTGAVSAGTTVSAGTAITAGTTISATGAVTGATVAANGNGTVSGVIVPKSYTTEAAATAALVSPATGSTVWLTAPTTGPVGEYVYNGTSWSFSNNTPTARLKQSATQSPASGTIFTVSFDAEDVDTHNGHSTTVNNSRYTAPVPGWYSVAGRVSYAANATGVRIAALAVNGVELERVQVNTASVGTCGIPIAELVFLNATDYVELWGDQTSGGALATNPGSTLNIFWVHA